mgnify:CR=1 FL=1
MGEGQGRSEHAHQRRPQKIDQFYEARTNRLAQASANHRCDTYTLVLVGAGVVGLLPLLWVPLSSQLRLCEVRLPHSHMLVSVLCSCSLAEEQLKEGMEADVAAAPGNPWARVSKLIDLDQGCVVCAEVWVV